MLWGIDPLLDADLLYALRRMGHGDEIAVVDTNYPAASTAMSTVTGEPLLMAGVSAARAVEAILSVMPLDTFVPDPAGRMEVVGDPDDAPDLSAPEWAAKLAAAPVRRGRPRAPTRKVSTTIRLDADVLAACREKGEGWQTRVNAALRDWLKHH